MSKKKKGFGCAAQVAQQPGVSYVGCFVLVMLNVEFASCLKFGISHCFFFFSNSHNYMEILLKAGHFLQLLNKKTREGKGEVLLPSALLL